MQPYLASTAQLCQVVSTPPRAIWSIERHNLGYFETNGYFYRGDGQQRGCHGVADLAPWAGGAAGSNKWCETWTWNEQSRNQYFLQSDGATGSAFPRPYDYPIGLIRNGSTCGTKFANQRMRPNANNACGFPAGSPAFTTALLTLSWPKQTGCAFSFGKAGAGGWAFNRISATQVQLDNMYGGAQRRFVFARSPDVDRTYFVLRKQANAPVSQWEARQDGIDLVQDFVTEGTMALTTDAPYWMAAFTNDAQRTDLSISLLVHWNAYLEGTELANLECYLERLRVH